VRITAKSSGLCLSVTISRSANPQIEADPAVRRDLSRILFSSLENIMSPGLPLSFLMLCSLLDEQVWTGVEGNPLLYE
jgi:hypothetical protein